LGFINANHKQKHIMKARKLGCITQVSFSAADVAAFNAQWPCSCLPEKRGFVEFERNGDLVGAPEWMDGSEGLAFVSDCQDFADKN
jgi:hypothetical protein